MAAGGEKQYKGKGNRSVSKGTKKQCQCLKNDGNKMFMFYGKWDPQKRTVV